MSRDEKNKPRQLLIRAKAISMEMLPESEVEDVEAMECLEPEVLMDAPERKPEVPGPILSINLATDSASASASTELTDYRYRRLHCYNCAHCDKVLNNPRDIYKFSSKLKDAKVGVRSTVGDSLQKMINLIEPESGRFSPVKHREFEHRAVCGRCGSLLKTLEKRLNEFMQLAAPNGYVAKKIALKLQKPVAESSCAKPCSLKTESDNSAPGIGPVSKVTVIRKPLVKKKKNNVITNSQLVLLRSEIKRLGKAECLRQPEPEPLTLINLEKLDLELKQKAPNIRRCIVALTGCSKRENILTPPMATVVCVLAQTRNMFANSFQSKVSLALKGLKASKKVFSVFHKFGLSIAIKTTYRKNTGKCDENAGEDEVASNDAVYRMRGWNKAD